MGVLRQWHFQMGVQEKILVAGYKKRECFTRRAGVEEEETRLNIKLIQ